LKKNKLFFSLLGLLLLLVLIISSLSVNVKGVSTLDYTFDDDVFYEASNPSVDKSANIRNQTTYTGTYNATYSFTNDYNQVIEGWIIDDGADCKTSVLEYLDGHDKVLNLTDNSGTYLPRIKQDFSSSQVAGSIEFYMRTNNVAQYSIISLFGSGEEKIRIAFRSSQIQYLETAWTTLIYTALNDVWYHIRIEFDCTTDKMDIFVDGKKEASNDDFFNVATNLEEIIIETLEGGSGYSFYIDAIGYNWESYEIWDNVIPYNYKNNIQEIDNWGFFNNEDGSTTDGYDMPYFIEIGSYPTILHLQGFNDGAGLEIPAYNTVHQGIYKDFQIANGFIREVSFRIGHSWNIPFIADITQNFDIKSYDDTLIVRLKIGTFNATHSQLYQYDGSAYNELQLIKNNFYYYPINFTIVNNIVFLNVNLTNFYYFPLITKNKEGIGEIRIECYLNASYQPKTLHVDYVAVYIDGVSLSNDFANYWYKTDKTFNNKNDNFFYFNCSGFFSLSMSSFETNPQTFNYFEYQNVSNINFMNVYSEAEKIVQNAYLTITTNTTFEFNYILISSVNLIEGINSYNMIFDYDNVNIDENYFWVDSNNRLQFKLNVNDTNLEYIQATFNIIDIITENRSISFISNINGESKGFFSLDYSDDTINLFEFPYYMTSTKIILPQTKTIETFTILITDNDLDDNDVCTGFISSISLIYDPDISLVIFTLNLLEIIVPLIVMLLPSLVMRKRFGITGVIIMFILMSLICVISNLIPVWLFFIIAFGSIGFLIMKKQIEGVK